MKYSSTKVIDLGSCAFRQPLATSHCKRLHGYRLSAKFWFEADKLDHLNWVVNFGGLKELKAELEMFFDHTTCIDREDPLLHMFMGLNAAGGCDLRIMDGVGIEKFAELCLTTADTFVRKITKDRPEGICRCVQAEVWEHPQNSAIVKY